MREVLQIGGDRPTKSEALYISRDGYVLFDDNWSTLAGREIVAQLVEVSAREIDRGDVFFI